MAKYYLVQEVKKELQIIDFSKISGFLEFDSTNLKDIITFTGMYKDETELKQFLLHHNLIKEDNFNKKLKITYKYKKQNKTLMYGVTYEDDLEFFNEANIKKFFSQNKDNYELLEILCNHYRNSYNQGLNIDTIRAYIRFFKQYEVEDNTDYIDDDKKQQLNEYERAINSFIFKELHTFDKKREEYKQNFRGLRDLAMFLSYQIKKQNKQTEQSQVQQEENEQIKQPQIQHESEKIQQISKELQREIDLKNAIEEHRNEREEFLTEEDYKKVNQNEEELTKEKVKTKTKQFNIPRQLTFEDMGWK